MSLRAKLFNFLRSGTSKDRAEKDLSREAASQNIRWEVREMVNRFTAAIGRKDLPTLLELVTDDVVLVTPSRDPIVERQGVEALCNRLFNAFNIEQHTDFAVKTSEIRTSATVHAFPFVALTALNSGAVVQMRGSVIGCLRYENRIWKISRILSLVSWPELELY